MEHNYYQVSRKMEEQLAALSEAVFTRQCQDHTELTDRFQRIGRTRALQDMQAQLSFLAEAVATERPALFTDYVAWLKTMLLGRGIPLSNVVNNLTYNREVLQNSLPPEIHSVACAYVDMGIHILDCSPEEPPTFLHGQAPLADLSRQFLEALLRAERHEATRLIMDAVQSGISVRDIYLHVFQRSQYEIGRLWQMNHINVAQEHYCSAATQMIMAQLYPYIFSGKKNGYRLVATCVSGELHEIGIRMITDLLEMDGWDTYFLGASTPADNILQALQEQAAHVLAVSATMTFHVRMVAELIQKVRSSELGKTLKIMVGGYPFNVEPELWQKVGADAFARDAKEAVSVAKALITA
ncbi:cobalamin B12-binding domain-containing protein [Heliobacterium chlorum]|uniref:Cobalamin B12-binding domain-containing protein n=1 Tax=Heliobacterium chlorum TaxID=2698 RepID=A0ABR7SZF2_HELCL|nr:cobalamin-dependent protein [Heliobacterium chlorum]MBC9783113.1 cobalamin B12-binding domain-containing protein [Heliobacterium chlorum]